VKLTTLLSAVQSHPNAFQGITLANLMSFVAYASKLKDDILLVQSVNHAPCNPPLILPQSVAMFLVKACEIASKEQVDLCWDLLKDMIWNEDPAISAEKERAAFTEHGHGLGISNINLHLQVNLCMNNACSLSYTLSASTHLPKC
jgi:hypothetical protein